MNSLQPFIVDISANHRARELNRDADQHRLASETSRASSATRGSVAAGLVARLVRAISAILPTAHTGRQAA